MLLVIAVPSFPTASRPVVSPSSRVPIEHPTTTPGVGALAVALAVGSTRQVTPGVRVLPML